MARIFSRYSNAAEAVKTAIENEKSKRGDDFKPVELIKTALAAYLSYVDVKDGDCSADLRVIESDDCRELRRGTKAAVDRMLFNANYWRAAYESRIVEACDDARLALGCIDAITVWKSHPLRLNRLSPDEAIAAFERFEPPFTTNNRRGSKERKGTGKGPLPDLKQTLLQAEQKESKATSNEMRAIVHAMRDESELYEELASSGSLDALFLILPAWCLQNQITLVNGTWWDDAAVMEVIIDALHDRFLELGLGDAVCRYFSDSCYEALDAYHHDLSSDTAQFSKLGIPELVSIVREARKAHPSFETDGYGEKLPSWLMGKEQLIWNIWVCSLYGPAVARPLLADSPDLLVNQNYVGKTDVITELAQTSFLRYTEDRVTSNRELEFSTFSNMPANLRESSIAYISSIPSKLSVLGYEVMPLGSCYPERRVVSFTESEIECLAILEHRRWLDERTKSGWTYGEIKDVDMLTSPYLVPWEELGECPREWNRSAVRSIPQLLASVGLAIVR